MRVATPLMKKLFACGLLAMAVLAAQQFAALHWLSHAIEATQRKAGGGSAPADHCDECLALGALGSAATSSQLTLPPALAHHALAALPPVTLTLALLRLAFRSRAPPLPV